MFFNEIAAGVDLKGRWLYIRNCRPFAEPVFLRREFPSGHHERFIVKGQAVIGSSSSPGGQTEARITRFGMRISAFHPSGRKDIFKLFVLLRELGMK